jgi:hypothetical protein
MGSGSQCPDFKLVAQDQIREHAAGAQAEKERSKSG